MADTSSPSDLEPRCAYCPAVAVDTCRRCERPCCAQHIEHEAVWLGDRFALGATRGACTFCQWQLVTQGLRTLAVGVTLVMVAMTLLGLETSALGRLPTAALMLVPGTVLASLATWRLREQRRAQARALRERPDA